ncbi:DsbA family protein [Salinibacterium sp. SYSU T00001]|uniref:DsbA family protein n=1 Tax=Homoserinimonas sedimenticola TaxID=2986805 RepID=UPI002235EBC3|nr:DsbA family protein [Salinibacterium sedimenticola]MCW4384203.1 DsbA family protein [Salinibacterium sedimenticola]
MAKKDDDRILAIRQKANEARQQQKRAEVRRKAFLQIGVIVAVLVVVGGIVFAVVAINRASQEVVTPEASATVTVGESTDVPLEVGEGAVRVGSADAPTTVAIYEDFSCPHCQDYEAIIGDTLVELVASGDAAVEYHPINIVTDYGVRAGSVATCVAVHEPESWLGVHSGLFTVHDSSTDAWSYEQFATFLDGQGIGGEELLECVESGRYANWIEQNTREALDSGVTGTPTVYINGEKAETLPTAEELQATVAELAG